MLALGCDIGPSKLLEDIYGSDWNRKIMKIEAMRKLMDSLNVKAENILIVGVGEPPEPFLLKHAGLSLLLPSIDDLSLGDKLAEQWVGSVPLGARNIEQGGRQR